MNESTPRPRHEDEPQPETLRPETIVVKNRGEATVKILETFKAAQQENYSGLDYHNENHPEFVRKKALEFAKIIMREDPSLVTKDTLAEIVNSAASHDSVLNVARGEMIIRFRGFFEEDIPAVAKPFMQERGITKGNEKLSAEYLEKELDQYVDVAGNPIFDTESRSHMVDAIAATFPEVLFAETIPDEDMAKYFSSGVLEGVDLSRYRTGIKFWQPHLKPESPISVLAVAEADLRGGVADEDPEHFGRDGDAEFRELSLGFREALQAGIDAIPQNKRTKAAENMLKWIKSQASFAMWQKVLFWDAIDKNQEIAQSPKAAEIKKDLADHYNPLFDRSILAAKKRYEEIERTFGKEGEERKAVLEQIDDGKFRQLLTEMGYSTGTA